MAGIGGPPSENVNELVSFTFGRVKEFVTGTTLHHPGIRVAKFCRFPVSLAVAL